MRTTTVMALLITHNRQSSLKKKNKNIEQQSLQNYIMYIPHIVHKHNIV